MTTGLRLLRCKIRTGSEYDGDQPCILVNAENQDFV
jgi:hypothetical protein